MSPVLYDERVASSRHFLSTSAQPIHQFVPGSCLVMVEVRVRAKEGGSVFLNIYFFFLSQCHLTGLSGKIQNFIEHLPTKL